MVRKDCELLGWNSRLMRKFCSLLLNLHLRTSALLHPSFWLHWFQSSFFGAWKLWFSGWRALGQDFLRLLVALPNELKGLSERGKSLSLKPVWQPWFSAKLTRKSMKQSCWGFLGGGSALKPGFLALPSAQICSQWKLFTADLSGSRITASLV